MLQSDAASAHRHPSLVCVKHFLEFSFSRCLQMSPLVWFSCSQGESEWCILLWCHAARHLPSCWRLLLSNSARVCKSTELLRHKTPDFTVSSHWTWGLLTSQTSILWTAGYGQSFRNAFTRHSKGRQTSLMSVDETRLTYYISQGMIETPIRRGGHFCSNHMCHTCNFMHWQYVSLSLQVSCC